MSRIILGALLVTLALGCAPAVPPQPTAILSPSPTSTSTTISSPTPASKFPPDIDALLQEVQRMLAEAATLDYSLQGNAVVEALALYLSRPDREELGGQGLTYDFQEQMNQAGLETFIGVTLAWVETDPPSFVAAFGYNSIRIFWGPPGRPLEHREITLGDMVHETRLVGDELGVIFSYIGASTVTPDFGLLRWEDDGWQVVWPEPPEDPIRLVSLWITADGKVSFAADDLSLIKTDGSSWGAAFMEEDPFFECHACPHRYFEVLWERQGDMYVPQVSLPEDAPYYDRLWEVTQPSPYATLFEFLRRLRAGDEAGALELAVGPEVIEGAQDLGFDDTGRSFLVDFDFESMPETNVFYFTENDDDFLPKYVALLQPPEREGEHWLLIEVRQIS